MPDMKWTLSLLFLLSACGELIPEKGPGKANIRIRNQYAESLFTLSVSGADGGTQTVCEDQRIAAHDSSTFKDVFDGADGEPVRIQFSAMSLGERQSFDEIMESLRVGQTLEIQYDYDLATAHFAIRHMWQLH